MHPQATLALLMVLVAAVSSTFSGCGYAWRSNDNVWKRENIRNVYIEQLTNNTLKPGVEVFFTSALLREFSQGGRIKLVSDKNRADGVISGVVDRVESRMFSQTTADQVSKDLPVGQGLPSDFVIASEYIASATITVRLEVADTGRTLWTQSFSRQKVFPGSNQGGDIGNTSVLINDSRFSMSIGEVAQSIALDVHDLFFESF